MCVGVIYGVFLSVPTGSATHHSVKERKGRRELSSTSIELAIAGGTIRTPLELRWNDTGLRWRFRDLRLLSPFIIAAGLRESHSMWPILIYICLGHKNTVAMEWEVLPTVERIKDRLLKIDIRIKAVETCLNIE